MESYFQVFLTKLLPSTCIFTFQNLSSYCVVGRDICRHFCQCGLIYRSVLWFNTTLSSVQTAQVPLVFCESQPHPTCTTELTKIPWIFFLLGGRERKWKWQCYGYPPYFEQNTQTNPMSVRGEPAVTRFIVCHFTLPLLDLDKDKLKS